MRKRWTPQGVQFRSAWVANVCRTRQHAADPCVPAEIARVRPGEPQPSWEQERPLGIWRTVRVSTSASGLPARLVMAACLLAMDGCDRPRVLTEGRDAALHAVPTEDESSSQSSELAVPCPTGDAEGAAPASADFSGRGAGS